MLNNTIKIKIAFFSPKDATNFSKSKTNEFFPIFVYQKVAAVIFFPPSGRIFLTIFALIIYRRILELFTHFPRILSIIFTCCFRLGQPHKFPPFILTIIITIFFNITTTAAFAYPGLKASAHTDMI